VLTEPLFAVRESMRGGDVGLPLSENALFGYFLGVTRKLQKSSSSKVIIYVRKNTSLIDLAGGSR